MTLCVCACVCVCVCVCVLSWHALVTGFWDKVSQLLYPSHHELNVSIVTYGDLHVCVFATQVQSASADVDRTQK